MEYIIIFVLLFGIAGICMFLVGAFMVSFLLVCDMGYIWIRKHTAWYWDR